jgi:hypothetical protein
MHEVGNSGNEDEEDNDSSIAYVLVPHIILSLVISLIIENVVIFLLTTVIRQY